MIRLAVFADLEQIEDGYREHFAYERAYEAYTVFQEGVYPTRKDAEKALHDGALYVYEEEGAILGSMIFNGQQPKEYQGIAWPSLATSEQVMVIHLVMVRPSRAGQGIGSALVKKALLMAEQRACTAVRLDTGEQNIPAVSLYQKLGFQVVAHGEMMVGGAVSHQGHLFLEKSL